MRKRLQIVVSAILIVSPYLLYGIAQTSRLHAAVESNDVQRVVSALKPWKSLNGRDRHGSTPLSISIRNNNLTIAKLLLERDASIQFISNSGKKFDHVVKAVDFGRREFVKLFIDHGSKLNDGLAVQTAVEHKDFETLQLLLKNGARADGVALEHAVRAGNLRIVQRLLEYDVSVNAALPDGKTPLFTGTSLPRQVDSRIEVVTLLLRNGGAIDAESPDGRTLFSAPMYARPVPDLEMIDLLLRSGFPINKRDSHGNTQLYYAARAKKIDVIRILLKYGADANDSGVECLREADCRNARGILTALREAVDLTNYSEKYAETSAEIASLLLDHGAKANVIDRAGNTPLFIAIYTNNFPAAERLLKAGANWEIGQPKLKPMDIARKKGRRFVDLLVAFGATPPR